MPAAELAFEYLAAALESTRGTAITAPTHYLPLMGTVTPSRTKFRPEEARGTKFSQYRAKTTRATSTWTAEGGADPNYLPLLLNMVVKGVTTPTTPSTAVLSRLWTFTPTAASDDIKSATMWFGDPNVQIFRSAYGMAQTLTIESDAGSEDGVTMSIEGIGAFPTTVSAPTLPAQSIGSLLTPGSMQLWIDTASAIGTTAITGRFISTSIEIPTGVTPKYYANGPTGGLGFTKTGVGKIAAKADITVELNDVSVAAEYAQYAADTTIKMRIRLNGDLIETISSTDFYNYIELDIYGQLSDFSWEEVEGVNRAMKFSLESIYDSTLAAPFSVKVQNAKTTL